MRLELFSVGTELLLGEIVDTNAAYLADKLSELGINVFYKTTVGDNVARAAGALRISLERADGILATGGLGPTEDDITAAAIAEVTGLSLDEDAASAEHIRTVVRQRGHRWLDSLLKQARLPRGAIAAPNSVGTAPGFILRTGGKTIIALPGPPAEMKPMFEQTVYPYLAGLVSGEGGAALVSRVLRFTGIGESQIEAELRDLISAQTNPTIAPLAKPAEVHIRITARAGDREEASRAIAPVEAEIRKRLGEHITSRVAGGTRPGDIDGADSDTLESVVGDLLRKAGKTLAVAESCTGGLIGHRLTNIPGSSDYLVGSLVTYSNEAKTSILGVPAETIETHGAVSAETAKAMAEGVRRVCQADIGLSVTGIAGPAGATASKPVGLTYLGLAQEGEVTAEERRLGGGRLLIKERAAQMALFLLYRHLRGRSGEGR